MRLRAFIVALALAVISTAALAQSLTFPELTGRVVDGAGILDASTREQLEKLSADLEAKTTDQLVIVTLKSLQGTSIEDYGYQLGRKWQIGQKDKNNGVIPPHRQARPAGRFRPRRSRQLGDPGRPPRRLPARWQYHLEEADPVALGQARGRRPHHAPRPGL